MRAADAGAGQLAPAAAYRREVVASELAVLQVSGRVGSGRDGRERTGRDGIGWGGAGLHQTRDSSRRQREGEAGSGALEKRGSFEGGEP